jgi:hypothetical protein
LAPSVALAMPKLASNFAAATELLDDAVMRDGLAD